MARHAGLVKDALRFGRSRKRIPQTDPYVAQLAKELLSRQSDPRRRGIEQCVELIMDLARRSSLEDAEAIGYLFLAIAQNEHRAAHPDCDCTRLTESEAHLAEEEAEGAVEIAETAMARDPSISNRLKFLTLSAAHIRARKRLADVVREELVAKHACAGGAR